MEVICLISGFTVSTNRYTIVAKEAFISSEHRLAHYALLGAGISEVLPSKGSTFLFNKKGPGPPDSHCYPDSLSPMMHSYVCIQRR